MDLDPWVSACNVVMEFVIWIWALVKAVNYWRQRCLLRGLIQAGTEAYTTSEQQASQLSSKTEKNLANCLGPNIGARRSNQWEKGERDKRYERDTNEVSPTNYASSEHERQHERQIHGGSA